MLSDPIPKDATVFEITPEWLIQRLLGMEPNECELHALRFNGQIIQLMVSGELVPKQKRSQCILQSVRTLDGERPAFKEFEEMPDE